MFDRHQDLTRLIRESDELYRKYEELKTKQLPDTRDLQVQRANMSNLVAGLVRTHADATITREFEKQLKNIEDQIKQPVIERNNQLKPVGDSLRKNREPIIERVRYWAAAVRAAVVNDGEFAEYTFKAVTKIEAMVLGPGDELLKVINGFEKVVEDWEFEKPVLAPSLTFRDLVSKAS